MGPTLEGGVGSRAPLELLSGLLAGDGPVPSSVFLRELAETFGADGAGLAEASGNLLRERLLGVEPAVPWADDPLLRKRVSREARPIVHARGNQQFLCASSGPERVLWVEKADDSPPWDESEQQTFGLIGLALARRLSNPRAETSEQDRLEDAVQVARRLAHVYSNVLTSILGF